MSRAAAPAGSVLIPVYNAAAYLTEALDSIAAQTFADVEIVALNDGSTDRSGEILADYAAREPRLRVVSRSNRGVIATRNELLAAATGPIIAWMDADDVSLPTRIERQLDLLRSDPGLVCVGCDARQTDERGRLLARERYPLEHAAIADDQARGGGLRFATTMLYRDVARQAGGFREPFRMGEDFDFLLRVAELGRLANIPEELYLYRQHLASACAAHAGLWFRYRDEILALAAERRASGSDRLQRGETIRLPVPSSKTASRQQAEVLEHWSAVARGQGDRRRALEYAARSVAAAPLRRPGWRALWRTVRPS